MRKGEAYNRGLKDGREGKEPNPVGGKTAYALGYNQGASERRQQELKDHMSKRKGATQ